MDSSVSEVDERDLAGVVVSSEHDIVTAWVLDIFNTGGNVGVWLDVEFLRNGFEVAAVV